MKTVPSSKRKTIGRNTDPSKPGYLTFEEKAALWRSSLPTWEIERVDIYEDNVRLPGVRMKCPRKPCQMVFYTSLKILPKKENKTRPCPHCFNTSIVPRLRDVPRN